MLVQDQHLHSRHSSDSQADPVENVKQALAKGLAGLIFTEHFDTHPDDWGTCVYDDAIYNKTISLLRSEFGNQIFIGKGIEVCFQLERMDFILDFLGRHQFDLVILSVHYFEGLALHKLRSWKQLGHSAETGTHSYLQSVLDAVRWCEIEGKRHGRVFDVLGHLDLAKRYTHRYFDHYDISPFSAQIDQILQSCLAADLIPEINTSSLRQGLEETMPGPATVQRYAQLGGKSLSLGSDSHRSEDIGAGFETAIEMLKQARLSAAIYQKRQRQDVLIGQ